MTPTLKEVMDELENLRRLDSREEAVVEENLVPCPKCGGEIGFWWSVCTSPECCDIPHRIECHTCSFEREGYDAVELVKKYLKPEVLKELAL